MSPDGVVLAGAGAILLVTAVSGRLERVWLTEPLVATALGVIAGLVFFDGINLTSPLILTVLELTLALVLFSDASRINLAELRKSGSWALRMLIIGLPIVILAGWALSGWYLGLPVGLALLLGVLLAPTDAALAEPVLTSNSVPERIRQTLNVESGLNDGLAVPALLIALAVIDTERGATIANSFGLVVSQLGIGIVGGLVVGWVGAKVIGKGADAGWMSPLHQRIAALALALSGFAAVQLLGGSGFVTTFIAGAVMAAMVRPREEYLYEFAEAEGHSLVLLAFVLFGAGPGAQLLERGAPAGAFVVALVSLVLIRPAAIALSLIGIRLQIRTVLFLGWFGPRGLATLVFLLVALETLGPIDRLVLDVVTITVFVSIVAHGVTAVPMSRWLGDMSLTGDMPEKAGAYPHRTRRRS